MTKKDYIKIAGAISKVSDSYAHNGNASPQAVIYVAANMLADTLASDNARFDRARFLKACKLLINVKVS